jgi:hypothetical protein
MHELPFDNDNATVKVIMTVYHDFTPTTVPSNVWRAFRAPGVAFDTRREPYWLLFDEVKLRENAGFRELCSVDVPLDQVSGQRSAARFGWSNKPE